MSKLKETVFVGRDNAIRIELKEDGVILATAYPGLTPTRWLLTIHAASPVVIDSDTNPEAFEWDGDLSIVELRLGSILTTATSYVPCTLRLFSAEFPNGVVFVHPLCTTDKLFIRICTEG